MSKKIFLACLGTETNSFSPIPTGFDLFKNTMLVRGGNFDDRPNLFALPIIAWARRAQEHGWNVSHSLSAFATPAGNTTRSTFESLRDEILRDLKTVLPVDAVLLNLHGAMIADGYPDAEGDLLAKIRTLVGPDVFIGAELDLHCHLTEQKVSAADVLVTYKEYPHVDVVERAEELFTLAENALHGQIRPVMAMYDCKMLGFYPTTREPLLSFVTKMKELEGKDGILSVSLAHGFPWGDTPEVGTRVLVVANGDQGKAAVLAAKLGQEVWAARQEFIPPLLSIDDAIARVLARNATEKPFVLADVADNPGLGAAGDSTFLLRRLIDYKAGGFALSPFFDPSATSIAFAAGKGASLNIRLGGKHGPASGVPIDVPVTVMKLTSEAYQPFGGAMAPLGNMAWLRIGGIEDMDAIDVVVNDHRNQSFHPDCFRIAGIDPTKRKALIVKSSQHFHSGFAPIAQEIMYVSAPGTGSMDMKSLAYTQVTRPLWPLQSNPHI